MAKKPGRSRSEQSRAATENPSANRPAQGMPAALPVLMVSLLTLLIYLPALQNGFVNWDDGPYVTNNLHIRSLDLEFFRWALTDTSIVYWHPLTWISHALDYAIWGLNPLGHHLSSIILHAINSGIVVVLVRLLLSRAVPPREDSPAERQFLLLAAGITGLLFGIHPLHVESAAWIAERKDLLYALFYLLAIITYLQMHPAGGTAVSSPFRSRRYYATLAFFGLSLASKPMAISLPVILLLLDWYPLGRFRAGRLSLIIVEKLPFLLLSTLCALSTLSAQQSAGALTLHRLTSLGERILVALHSLVFYLWKTLLPIDLLPFYPYPKQVSLAEPAYLSALLLVATISGIVLQQARKRPYLQAIWCFFLITILPVLGLIQAGVQSASDHYVYLPITAILILPAALAARLLTGPHRQIRQFRPLMAGTLLLAGAVLSYLTFAQIGIWKDSVALWNSCIEKKPGLAPEIYYLRGLALGEQGEIERAIADYTSALHLDDTYRAAHLDRGLLLLQQEKLTDAIADFSAAIAIDSAEVEPYYLRAKAHERSKHPRRALQDYTHVIALDPEHDDAHLNRGLLFMEKHDYAQAIDDFNRAIEIDPAQPDAFLNRGNAYFRQRELRQAFNDYSSVTATWPDEYAAYVNRGGIYLLRGETDQALDDYSRAIALKPDAVEAYRGRGDIYAQMSAMDQARADYLQACELGDETACRKSHIRQAPTEPGIPEIDFKALDAMFN